MIRPSPRQLKYLAGAIGVGGAATGAVLGARRYDRRNPPEYSLYLGGKQGTKTIPRSSVSRFMKKEVQTRLPGYSQTNIRGVWGGQPEPTRVISYIGNRKDNRKIHDIAHAYQKRFKQDSVLIKRQRVRAEFT